MDTKISLDQLVAWWNDGMINKVNLVTYLRVYSKEDVDDIDIPGELKDKAEEIRQADARDEKIYLPDLFYRWWGIKSDEKL